MNLEFMQDVLIGELDATNECVKLNLRDIAEGAHPLAAVDALTACVELCKSATRLLELIALHIAETPE